MARDVTILSMNCRGLADVEKRNDVLHYLKKKNTAFIVYKKLTFRRNTQSNNFKMGI